MSEYQKQVNKDWATSQNLIDTHVVPHLATFLNGSIVSLDKDKSALEAMLDRQAGIDALLNYQGLVYGLALRVGKGEWDNFTVRWRRSTGLATEYQKHSRASEAGSIAPYLTAQAYITGNSMSIGVAHLGKLYQWVEDNIKNEYLIQRRKSPDNNTFLVVRWSHLENMNWFRRWDTTLN